MGSEHRNRDGMLIKFPINPVQAPRTPDAFRREIISLIQSYHGFDIDFLAEVIQNSVDAIEDKFEKQTTKEKPNLELEVNTDDGLVTVRDNGIGVSDDIIQLLALPIECTDKWNKRKRGHKGVGLSFAIWSSQLFRFATKRLDRQQIVSGKLEGAINWISSGKGKVPCINQDPSFKPPYLKKYKSGTVFEFTLGEKNPFNGLLRRLNNKGLETLVRTATAAGFADLSAHDNENYPEWVKSCKFKLKVDGKLITFPLGYYFPDQHFSKYAFNIRRLRELSLARQSRLLEKMKCIYTYMDNSEIQELFKNTESDGYIDLVKRQEVTAYGAFLDSATTFKSWNNGLYRSDAGPGRLRKIVIA